MLLFIAETTKKDCFVSIIKRIFMLLMLCSSQHNVEHFLFQKSIDFILKLSTMDGRAVICIYSFPVTKTKSGNQIQFSENNFTELSFKLIFEKMFFEISCYFRISDLIFFPCLFKNILTTLPPKTKTKKTIFKINCLSLGLWKNNFG